MSESSAISPAHEAGAQRGEFRVGVLGAGTVGGSFVTLLSEHTPRVERITGLTPVISGVIRRASGPSFAELLTDSDLIVELIGGIEPARTWVLQAIGAGKHVVTANKQLLAQHGEELYAAAREAGVQLRFEGAVAGVVPVVRVLMESLAGAKINRIHGIVNGTSNFILSEMSRLGWSYDQALAEAQRLGYAEADPSEDINGKDAAAKMAILARLAFDVPVHLDQVPYEGIDQITADDVAYARQFDLGLKLVGTAERVADGISVRVHPLFLRPGHPLASIGGAFNAVTLEGDEITEITLSGPGAGGPQTASAVLGDVVSAMIPPASAPNATRDLPMVDDVESAFYVNFAVADEPGVLAEVARLLSEHGVSVRSVLQRGLGSDAALAMITHRVLESQFAEAVEEISKLDVIRKPPRVIRVLDEEFT